jgi:hypothetical protein
MIRPGKTATPALLVAVVLPKSAPAIDALIATGVAVLTRLPN